MGVYTLHACRLRRLVQAHGSQILPRHGRSNVSSDNNEQNRNLVKNGYV